MAMNAIPRQTYGPCTEKKGREFMAWLRTKGVQHMTLTQGAQLWWYVEFYSNTVRLGR